MLTEDVESLVRGRKKRPIDISFSTACREFNKRNLDYKMPLFEHREVEKFHYEDDGKLVVAFSGGKLSLACALRYKDIGKDIILFHVASINEDTSRIEKIAQMLNVPLVNHVYNVWYNAFSGIQLLHLATQYAVGHQHSPRIVYGYFDDALVENNEEEDWANCSEFINSYKEAAQKYIDGFTILNPIPNYSIMWDELLSHRAYLKYVKYNDVVDMRVFENIQMDYRVVEANKSSYMNNFRYLISSYKRRKEKNQATLNEIWNEYFFYRIENSICYGELMEKYS